MAFDYTLPFLPHLNQLVVSTLPLPGLLESATNQGKIHIAEQLKQQVHEKMHHPRPPLRTPYVPPSNEIEKQIVPIWEEVLGIAGIGVEDNFFELGGDSLLAMQVTSRLRRAFSVSMDVKQLFELPQIAVMAQRMRQQMTSSDREGTPKLVPTHRDNILDLLNEVEGNE
jgi:acyl carrier protein